MRKNPQGYWEINIKSKRIRGGRAVISSRTRDEAVALRRLNAFRKLIEWGDDNLVEAVRRAELPFDEVERAANGEKHSVRMDALRSRFVVGEAPSTISEAIDLTLQTVSGALTPNAIKHYQALKRALAADANTLVADYSSIRAQRFISEDKATNRGKPWGPNTQHLVRTICKRVFDDAIHVEAEEAERQGRAPRYRINPFRRLTLPKARKTRLRVLTHDEWLTLEKLLEDTPDLALIACMLLGGLRLGEALNVRHVDIDFEQNVIHIQERDGPHPWQPKQDRSSREVEMTAELRTILSRHIELGYAGEEYVLIVPGRDRPMSSTAARDRVKRAFTAAGIAYGTRRGEATAHTLRHTAATWWLLENIPVPVVADMLGDTVAVVLDTYAHVLPNSKQEAMQQASRGLQRAAAERKEQTDPEEE